MKTVTKEVEDFCKRIKITPAQFTGEEIIEGNLMVLHNVTIPPDFTPRVTGGMSLQRVTKIPHGFAPIVGGVLQLEGAVEIGDNFAPVVSGSLFLRGAITIGDNFAPVVGARLDMRNAVTIGNGFSPAVGGSFWILKSTTIPPGSNIAVGGGFRYLRDGMEFEKLDSTKPIEAQDGRYIIVERVLVEVIARRGNVWRVKRINKNKVFYLVTDGLGNFAFGDTLKEAKDFLIYKVINTDTSIYEGLKEDSMLTFSSAVKMYRSITCACPDGVREFVKAHDIKKKSYTIKEIIDVTVDQFGHEELVEFFNY